MRITIPYLAIEFTNKIELQNLDNLHCLELYFHKFLKPALAVMTTGLSMDSMLPNTSEDFCMLLQPPPELCCYKPKIGSQKLYNTSITTISLKSSKAFIHHKL